MLAHTVSTVAMILVAAGITFQLALSARFGARAARAHLPWRSTRPRTPHAPPKTTRAPQLGRRPRRDYRAAVRRPNR